MVQDLPEWTPTRELADTDVPTLRKFLNDWVATRKNAKGEVDLERLRNAPNQITWPDPPTPADRRLAYKREAKKNGKYVVNWERPPQSRVKKSGLDA